MRQTESEREREIQSQRQRELGRKNNIQEDKQKKVPTYFSLSRRDNKKRKLIERFKDIKAKKENMSSYTNSPQLIYQSLTKLRGPKLTPPGSLIVFWEVSQETYFFKRRNL